ncbi:methylated-DNA--[protein]-cysteine S-methyltransferase [Avibacterium volantium]|uniref:methylated-DNA--[protein]-cysteine S-methyltransferase n=1 Tax=Avibacterium volantium TaxID=762 RepID=A0A447SPB6_AVIVO|nr:methylated-DNA--[protein]-cysteine S-methyltransferase [Avibacterium volantium]VEB22834.1 Methylated-DNA--protein-cysteine methyltransferase, constitutive [Avibacterium volantium]
MLPPPNLSPILAQQWQPYASWLDAQACPPKSYLLHPISSPEELKQLKQAVKKELHFSLGCYIRLKRVHFLLHTPQPQYQNQLTACTMVTPLGEMLALFWQEKLCLLEFYDRKMLESELTVLQKQLNANIYWQKSESAITLQQELDAYFTGTLTEFRTKLYLQGTPFQQQVWNALQQIPYGETRSYKQQAEYMAQPNAIRAVANANGKNKISILIPCHRVIGADGTLTGYGGGIERKKALLTLEQNHRIYYENS